MASTTSHPGQRVRTGRDQEADGTPFRKAGWHAETHGFLRHWAGSFFQLPSIGSRESQEAQAGYGRLHC